MLYRQLRTRATWHWCLDCSEWPLSDFLERADLPPAGAGQSACAECAGIDAVATARSRRERNSSNRSANGQLPGVDRNVESTLKELIETSREGEEGFARAAKDSNDAVLTAIFQQAEQRCRVAAIDLQGHVRVLVGHAQEGGSLRAVSHRGWPNLKAVMGARGSMAILEECEKGEDYAKARYAEAVGADLSEALRAIVERQYKDVVASHRRMRDLRNQYRSRPH